MKRSFRALSLALTLALAMPLASAFAEGLGPMSPEQRQALMDTVRQLHQDPQFQALKGQLKGNLNNRAVVDNYLRYLPISPLQMLRVEMEMGRFEFAVPPVIHQQEQRWMELHPAAAAKMRTEESAEIGEVESGSSTESHLRQAVAAATAGTNRNTAATSSPAPIDYQGEIQVVVNPNNPSQVVAAANTWDDMGGTCGTYGLQAVFYSGDGGATWNYTCPPNDAAYGLNCAALGGGTFGSDPALSWNANNEVFLNYMLLCYNGSYFYSMVVARSANGGATWSAQGVVKNSWPTGDLEDKNFYAIDTNAGSPFLGRHYTCWDRSNDERFAYSTNNGASWTEVNLPSAGGGVDLGCDIAVQKNGTVHVIWNSLSCLANCSNEQTYYSRSTNGGVSWSTPVLVVDPNLVGFSNKNCPSAQDDRCIGPFGSIDVDNSGGACDGTLYVTYSDFPSGGGKGVNNSDVWVRRSTNNGGTWSSGVRINDDGSGGNVQFNAFLVVDQVAGTPVVAWQDARNDTNNRKMDIYTSRSTDCGLTFAANTKATGPSGEFNNSTISYSDHNSLDNTSYNPNQTGEYMGLDARGGKAYIAWSDTRHYFPSFTTEAQKDNVGFAVVDFGAVTPPDTTPPAAPTGLTATAGKRKITLNWTANTEPDLAGYNVYRSSSSTGTYTKLNTSLVTANTYTNSSLTSGTTWFYRVTAVDTSNNESAVSNTASATAN
jgi:hypothetical protein